MLYMDDIPKLKALLNVADDGKRFEFANVFLVLLGRVAILKKLIWLDIPAPEL